MSVHHPALKGKIVRALPGMLDTDNSVPDYPAETWAVAAPKRTFAAPIAVGTIDQALLSILRSRHAWMRAAFLLLTTINNAAKEAALKDRSLNEAFDVWWPKLEEKVEAISSTQPPTEQHRSDTDLLEEAVSNTRTILRELQGLPPWLRFTLPNPEVAHTVEALRRGVTTPPPTGGILYPSSPGYDDGR